MALEDFFTLTELKDGLTVTSRVEELVSAMQSNKDSVLKDAGQWKAVARTIAVTKNRECLDVFVNLDGLSYLSSWLAEAQTLGSDSVDRSVEEAILALLEALENIGVDGSRLVSSGIWVAVKKLVDHGSSRVQEQARKLSGSWKDKVGNDHSERDIESCSKAHDHEMRVVAVNMESSGVKSAVTLCSTQSSNEKQCPEIADEASPSGSSGEENPDQDKGLELQNDKGGFASNVNSHCSNTITETLNGSSTDIIMKEFQENLPLNEEGSTRETVVPTGSCSLVNSERDCVEDPSNTPLGAETAKEKQIEICGSFREKIGGAEAVAVSSSSAGHIAVSSDSVVANMELEKNCLDELSRNASETVCASSQDVSIAHNNKHVPSLAHVTDNQDSDSSSRLSGGHGGKNKVDNDSMAALSQNEDKEDDKSHLDIEKKVKRRKKRRSSRPMTVSQRLGAIDKTTADIDLGILDALEVATNIAQEVAREVDSGEAFHSSSEELSDESGESDSQNSHDYDLHTGSPSKGLSMGESHPVEELHVADDVMEEKNNILENGMMSSDDVKEKHLAAAATNSEVGREKSPCGFDLNEDICPDETDVVMSAAAPLQFERSLSAKGSGASSVSHSEVPHNVPSRDLREKQQVICIDLNVAEVGDDQVEDKTPWKQFPFSSSNSRDGESSSHVANLQGSSRFNLDLNCTNEDDDMPPPSKQLKMETRLFLSQQSASPVSSLSVAQQSGKELNFDLNDRPQFFIESRDQGPYYGQQPWSITAPYGGHRLAEPGISILGTKVDVDRKETVSQMSSFLSNGKSIEPAAAGLFMGTPGNSLGLAPGVSFSPAPMYGYTGHHPGMSSYVPGTAIPYMVDARGAPVMIPQMMGSAPYAQPPYPQQHMFMSLSSGSPSMNGLVRPSQFDQSSGFGVEMGNRDGLSLRQFLAPGDMGEHSRASVEPSSSLSIGIGGKRKEPETPRWEFPPWR